MCIRDRCYSGPTNSPGKASPLSRTSPLCHHNDSPSLLSRSATSPVFPSFKPQEQRFIKPKDCSLITAVELGKIMETVDEQNLLVLDTRPFTEYSKSTVENSIHICLPSTLLRRKNFTLEKLLDNLNGIDQSVLRTKLNLQNLRIIVYDNTTNQTDGAISLACFGITSKLLDYSQLNPEVNYNISILASGFEQFKLIFPDLVDTTESLITSQNNSPTKRSANSTQSQVNLRLQMPQGMKPSCPGLINSPPNNNNNNNDNNIHTSASPVSASSPISALFKFQLPPPQTMSPNLFKISQNEELMNLESYLSAVNIKEEQKSLDEGGSLQSFQFPKRKSSDNRFKDKLSVQIKYEKLMAENNDKIELLNSVIPKWYQDAMKLSLIHI